MPRTADPQRREKILDAARQTFLRDGFADARMTDIAKRARIAVGTLYLYFDSKDAIANALAAATFAKAAAAILAVLDAPVRFTRARVALLVQQTFETVFADPTVGRIGIPLADVAPTLVPEVYARVVADMADALARQMERGSVRRYHPGALADYVVILLRRAVLQSAMHGRRREPYESTVVELLAGALLNRDAPRKVARRAPRR